MKKTISVFVMLMFLLSGVAFAQETEATTIEPVVTAVVTTTEEAPVPTLYEVSGGEEYSGLTQAWDRIKLAFTFQEERKVELMNKIQDRRQKHYDFLVAKGKTEQAEKFKEKTSEVKKNFDEWKVKRAEKLAKFEEKIANAKSNITEKRLEKANERADKIEERVQERVEKMEERVEKVDERLTQRENTIEQRTQNRVAINESD